MQMSERNVPARTMGPSEGFKERLQETRFERYFVILLVILLASSIHLGHCGESSAPSNRSAYRLMEQENPSQLFISSSAHDARQGEQSELEDSFIMKTPQVDAHETLAPDEANEEATTIVPTTLTSGDDSGAPPTSPEDDGRVAINATRQQFLTHDQLLNAATKDEQKASDQKISKPVPVPVSGSRVGMPRLAFASSFLPDFLFRSRQQQQQQAPPKPLDDTKIQQVSSTPTTGSPNAATSSQQKNDLNHLEHQSKQEHFASCPGVCLNFFVASLRCQNAIQAPCPSVFQKCCELDDVSFNGTPVETSAPLPNADSDPLASQASPDNTPDTHSLEGNRQANLPSTQRPQESALAAADKSQPQQPQPASEQPSNLPSNSASGGKQQATSEQPVSNHDHDHQPRSGSAVYFLSSGNDADGDQPPAAEPDRHQQQQEVHKPLEQQRQQLLPAKLEGASVAQPAQKNASAAVAIQQPDLKVAASQSFDPPVSTTTPASTTAATSAAGKLVSIQTANGTAYLQSSEPANRSPLARPSRPIYANWTDYHLLMMQSRAPGQLSSGGGGGGGGVVYHSNIDPVRSIKPTSSNETKSDDLSNQNLKFKPPFSTQAEPDADLKVLKDQHSSRQQPTIEPSTTTTTGAPTQPATTTSGDSATASDTVTNYAESSATSSQPQADNQHQLTAGMTDQQVSGIANFLGTLFDTFMTSTDAQNEARDPSEQQEQNLSLEEGAGGGGGGPIGQGPQNDRRLGLDLSFRQQNDTQPNQTQDGLAQDSLMASDQVASSAASLPKCSGYCSLDHFSHLCDSYHASSDCAPSQKCCVSSSQESGSEPNGPHRPEAAQQQACHGTCLPVYHSSLCMKPNQIQLDSPSCAPNQLCCSQPNPKNPVLDGSNYIDETNNIGDNQSMLGVDQQPPGGSPTDGSFNKEHSLSAALVPPPPPTVVVGQQQQQQTTGLLEQQSTSGRHVQSIPSTYQQISNSFQNQLAHFTQGSGRLTSNTTPATKSTANHQQTNSPGGLMNQILQMFKSNTGIGKQRPKQTQQQHLISLATPMIAQPIQQAHMIFESTAPAPNYQAIAANPLLRPTNMGPGAGQLVFAQATSNGPNGPLLINSPFVAPTSAQQMIQSSASSPFAHTLEQKPRQAQQISLEQVAQFYQADPAQFATMVQKQFNAQQPARSQQQSHLIQPLAHYQPLVQHQTTQQLQQPQPQPQPQPQVLMMMNQQRLHGHSAAKSQTVAPSNSPVPLPSHLQAHLNNQQQTRWTQMGQQLESLAAAGFDNAQNRPTSADGANKSAFQQRPAPSSLAFGPADAASAYSNRQKQQLAWTGTNQQPAGNRLGANLDQKPQQQWVQPATADANIVTALQHDASGAKQSFRPQPIAHRQQQVQSTTSRSQQQTGSASTKVALHFPTPVGSTTELPPVRRGSATIASAPSESSPVHTSAATTQLPGASSHENNRPAVVSLSVLDETAEEEPREQCPSACLPPLLSFKCHQPSRIDEKLACPTAAMICCVKSSLAQDEEPKFGSSDFEPSNTQAPESFASLATSQTGELGDEQADLMIASDQQPASKVLDAPGSAALEAVEQSSSNEQALSLSPVANSKVATACGLPGPSRRQDRKQSSSRLGRVMGGFDSEPGYWCWQAALMNGKNEYLCGGALIGSKWVLTAAHCVTQHLRSESQLFVRLGQTNLNSSRPAERRSAKSLLVKTSYVHHNHNGVTLDNDIALLRLDQPVDLSEPSICSVCLPERGSTKQPELGKRCTVTGYGFESESGPAALRVRHTHLPMVADLDCQNKTSEALGKPFVLPASSFCAGGELGQDACHGDGGSPLSCLVDGFYELTGIVSWGYKCGNQNLPGLYAKVSNFVGWINQIVSVNS